MEKQIPDITLIPAEWIDISLLDYNEGQIEGVPPNDRIIDPIDYDLLLKSLKDNPEELGVNEMHVVSNGNRYVVTCGNSRLKALRELGFDYAPCKVCRGWTAEQIRADIIKNNHTYGKNDLFAMARDWDAEEIEDWIGDVEWPTDEEAEMSMSQDTDEETNCIKVICNRGDIWQLGDYRLESGDEISLEEVKRIIKQR